MSLGEKLQKVHQKVNAKLGTQEGDLVFRKVTKTDGVFGKPYSSAANTDITIASGAKVGRVSTFEAGLSGGQLRQDDVKLFVPVNLLTEVQLKETTVVVYKGQSYSVQRKRPTEILDGVPVQWEIIARLETNG